MRKNLSTLLITLAVAMVCHFSALAVLGQPTVFGPKKYVRATGEPRTISDNFYVQDITGPFFIAVQNGSDTEGGISSAVIELNGTRLFGPSDFNNRVLLLRKSVSLRQQNIISIEVRGKPGTSITVTIRQGSAPPTSTQFTVYTNPTDPLWLRQETPEGDVIDFYGERDIEGLPTVLYGVNIVKANGDEITYYFDDEGRPILMAMPNGVTFSIQWQTETLIVLTATFNYGDSEVTVPIDLAAQSSNQHVSLVQPSNMFLPASFKLALSKTPVASISGAALQNIPYYATSVKVTRCGAPNNNAFVRIPIQGRPGPPILARPIGGGVYVAPLPIPPPNFARPLNKLCNALQQKISDVCDKIMALRLGGVQTGRICDAIAQAAGGDPRVGALVLACRIGFGALAAACAVAKPCAKGTAYLDRALSAPITFRPVATLYGITACGNTVSAPPNGPFPTNLPIELPCACQSGLGARLFSTGRNMEVTVVAPEAEYTSQIRLSSPVFRLIETNRYTGPPINISSYAVGAELVFSIRVLDTGQIFSTGPGSRNPDGLAHARIDCLPDGRVRVSFEDTLGGGDNDFDDAVFEIASGSFQRPPCQ